MEVVVLPRVADNAKRIERNKKIVDLYIDGNSCYKIAELVGLSPATVHKILKDNDVKTRSNKVNSRKYKLNENFFSAIDNERKAYWLGMMYADGYVILNKNGKNRYGQKYVCLSLEISDKEHVCKFVNDINSNYDVKEYKAETNFSKYTYARVQITSSVMFDSLVEKGVTERKSNVLTFPDYNIVPKHLMRHFIRGYVDGDGSLIIDSGNRLTLSVQGTEQFLTGLMQHLKINRKLEYRYVEDARGCYIRFGKTSHLEKVIDYLYKGCNVCLERKYNKYVEMKSLM